MGESDVYGSPRKFQSTPPHGGRRGWLVHVCTVVRRSFNPRPRTGGDACRTRPNDGRIVSIHAPARGATRLLGNDRVVIALFQSTPPHGGRRRRPSATPSVPPSFNPRPRTGGDLAVGAACLAGLVSIHAPARGATREMAAQTRRGSWGFNPRPRTGGDCPRLRQRWSREESFNPRPRTGGDLKTA